MIEPLSVIEEDTPCSQCGYNLRTLTVDQKCPECGTPIVETLAPLRAIADPEKRAWIDDAMQAMRRKEYEPIAQESGHSVDAIMFVHDALRWTSANEPTARSAAEICDGIRKYVAWYFNDPAEAKELLCEWGIKRSEDVGQIIFAMVDVGWLKAEPHESIRDFDGLFVL